MDTAPIVGASPANDAAMAASVQAGDIIDIETSPTLSDGTAGGIEPGSITFPLCRDLVDEWILVSEAEIADAMCLAIDTEHTLIEGAAGVALAAGMRYVRDHPGQTVVASIINSGAVGRNIDEVLRTLKAYQHVATHGGTCPANWHEGQAGMEKSLKGVAGHIG